MLNGTARNSQEGWYVLSASAPERIILSHFVPSSVFYSCMKEWWDGLIVQILCGPEWHSDKGFHRISISGGCPFCTSPLELNSLREWHMDVDQKYAKSSYHGSWPQKPWQIRLGELLAPPLGLEDSATSRIHWMFDSPAYMADHGRGGLYGAVQFTWQWSSNPKTYIRLHLIAMVGWC